jgi:carbonic anhydrase
VPGFSDVERGNAAYAERFTPIDGPARAAAGLAILTCMDPRVDPLAALGLSVGDAVVLRNPGAQVTDEVLRALVLGTHLLGVDRVALIGHTGCRMATATQEEIESVVAQRAGIDVRSLRFGVIADQEARLRSDAQRIRSWPFLPEDLDVAGYLWSVEDGGLRRVC